ncbi:MAG: hypothetical protein AAGH74_00070 [Pseudomonadota bacterium]
MRALLIVSTLALAAPALACPNNADLEGPGIVITFDDGSSSKFTRPKPNVIVEEASFPDSNEGFWLELWRGIYPIGSGGLIDGKRDPNDVTRTEYPVDLKDLPVGIRTSWSEKTLDFDGKGQPIGDAYTTVDFGRSTKITISGCTYNALDANTIISFIGNSSVSNLVYLTDLEIAVLVGEGSGNDITRLKPVSIAVAQ